MILCLEMIQIFWRGAGLVSLTHGLEILFQILTRIVVGVGSILISARIDEFSLFLLSLNVLREFGAHYGISKVLITLGPQSAVWTVQMAFWGTAM